MEFLNHIPNWDYTLLIALVLVAILIWKGRNFKIPRPRKKQEASPREEV